MASFTVPDGPVWPLAKNIIDCMIKSIGYEL